MPHLDHVDLLVELLFDLLHDALVALRDVRLPVRSVLARPEISLVKLLSLEVGDIISLTIPRNVPVTVAGRNFAYGSIGEANGNAAIMIERIEEGSDND